MEYFNSGLSILAIIISGLTYRHTKRVQDEQKQKEYLELKHKIVDITLEITFLLETNISYLTDKLCTMEVLQKVYLKNLSCEKLKIVMTSIENLKTEINHLEKYLEINNLKLEKLPDIKQQDLNYSVYSEQLELKKSYLSNLKILSDKYNIMYKTLESIEDLVYEQTK